MTLIHIVLFKFKPEVTQEHKDEFVAQLKTLRDHPSVHRGRLTVGGPSLTVPIERSKGFELALVSQHKDLAALEQYQASDEHHQITSKYLWPYKEDVTRFDFEIPDVAGHDWLE